MSERRKSWFDISEGGRRPAAAALALGICLSAFAPAARADYVDWKIGDKNRDKGKTGFVWKAAKLAEATAALDANDYALFQSLTSGFMEKTETQGKKGPRFKTGWTGVPTAFAGSFGDMKTNDILTFLIIDGKWDKTNSLSYHIVEKIVPDDPRLLYTDAAGNAYLQIQATTPEAFTTHGIIGAALTNGASLLIATDPAGLLQTGFSPAILTNGLTEGNEVTSAAPAGLVYEGAHYASLNRAVVQRWDTNVTPHAWSAPETNDVADGQYAYTHGTASGKITWLYERNGWLLDLGSIPAGGGTIATDPEPGLSGGCYADGASVTLTPVPATNGFTFIGWEKDGEDAGSGPSLTVSMDASHAVRAKFTSPVLTWAGNDGNVWKNGAAGWLAADGTATNWAEGATAVFTNDEAVTVSIDAEGVSATAVRAEGAAVELAGDGTLTMIADAATPASIIATNEGSAVRLNAKIASMIGLTIHANDAPGSFVIGTPTMFTGTLAIESGRLEFGPGGTLGMQDKPDNPWIFNNPITIAEGALLVTPAIKKSKGNDSLEQQFGGEISGGGAVLVENPNGDTVAKANIKNAKWTGGLTVGTNGVTFHTHSDPNALPTEGPVEAVNGGKIQIFYRSPLARKNDIRIGPGSALEFMNKGNSLKPECRVLVESGSINLASENNIELCNLIVTNGGAITITGTDSKRQKPLLFKNNGALTVRGDGVCSNSAGYVLQQAQDKNKQTVPATLTLDVADGAEATDLVISGEITGACPEKTIVKTGAGTAVFSGTTNSYVCTTRIDEGTLRLETDHAMGAAAPVELNGGTLDIGTSDNTQPGIGALALTTNSTIRIGGGKIAFAASPADGWATNATLDIEGELGKQTVKFGTDDKGLDQRQLGQITLNGQKQAFHLDALGWLSTGHLGTVILIR